MPESTFTQSGDFDLDSWIDDARLPERSVTVYGRADLVGEYEALEARFTQLDREYDRESSSGDARMTTGSERREVAQQMEQLRPKLYASALTFRFRALTHDETQEIAKRIPDVESDDRAYAMLEVQAIAPKVTATQWVKIRNRIGEGQFQAIIEAASSASFAKRVDLPFSFAASAALDQQES